MRLARILERRRSFMSHPLPPPQRAISSESAAVPCDAVHGSASVYGPQYGDSPAWD